MWVYSQASGTMYHAVSGKLVTLAKGYSGNGASENNPDDQCKADHGPLPRGAYTFGPPVPFNNMADCLRLQHDQANAMCGRSGFLIHDGVSNGPHGITSEGCICLPHAARLNMWASMDHELQVVRDEGSYASSSTLTAAFSASLLQAEPTLASLATVGYGSLVPGGFYSSDPGDKSVPRSIRCNNPGALNVSQWQTSRPGYVGYTGSDGSPDANHTTIYRTPEHGVASWYHLLVSGYGFSPGRTFKLGDLARSYAGHGAAQGKVDGYVSAWSHLSNGSLSESTVLDTGANPLMASLAQAMFWNEAGMATPLHQDQIDFAIRSERDGTLVP